PPLWKLNDLLLNKKEVIETLKDCAKSYLADNKGQDTKPEIIWEAHKCVLRGELIQIAKAQKRLREARVRCLTRDIQILETKHQVDTSLQTYKALTTTLQLHAKRSLHKTKHTYFTKGGKCGHLLSQSLAQQRQTTFIPDIRLLDGTLTQRMPDKIQEFLSNRIKNSLLRNVVEFLDSPIKNEEFFSVASRANTIS
ncbi:Hypothetical predicted protein, partial [Pelobates cultripes]